MSDPHLLELQGRLKQVLLETSIEEGYDRNASHAAGRYVAYQVGLGQNASYLDHPELATALAESAIERMLNSLTQDDLERLLDLLARRGEPLLHADDLTGDHTAPDMADALGAEGEGEACEALMAATPADAELDTRALALARQQAEDLGLPVPVALDQIKLGHWRRKALLAAWHARSEKVA